MVKKYVELGLSFNPREAQSEQGEEAQFEEKEKSYEEIGGERLKKTWDGIKNGFSGILSRVRSGGKKVAASPEIIGDAMRAAHERGGEIKDSVIEKMESGVGKIVDAKDNTKEWVGQKATQTHKNLETRATGAYNAFITKKREIEQAAQAKWESYKDFKKKKEHATASENLNKAMMWFNTTAEAVGSNVRYTYHE